MDVVPLIYCEGTLGAYLLLTLVAFDDLLSLQE